MKLKEAFGFDDYKIKKLSQIRFDMLTKEVYDEAKEKLKRLKEQLRIYRGK